MFFKALSRNSGRHDLVNVCQLRDMKELLKVKIRLGSVSCHLKEGFCKFSTKNNNLYGACNFLENENFAALASEVADFLELNS